MADSAKILIAEAWKKTGTRKPRRGTAAIYAGHSILLNNRLGSIAFQNHLELYDEFVAWIVDVATTLMYHHPTPTPEYCAYAHLASAICSLAFSVRHAACTGHDISAKILSRSLAEYSDVLALLIMRPELREEFQKNDNFWGTHVQGGKARRSVLATPLFNENGANAWSTEYRAFQGAEGKFASNSVHPSYVSAAMTMLAVDYDKEAWPGFMGRITDASVRTLNYAMQSLSLVVLLARFSSDDTENRPNIGLGFDPKNKLHKRIEARRYVLFQILKFLGTQRSERGVFKVKTSRALKDLAREERRNRRDSPAISSPSEQQQSQAVAEITA